LTAKGSTPLAYCLYIDKSGIPEPPSNRNPSRYVVLGGCVIRPPVLPEARLAVEKALSKWRINLAADQEFKWEHVSRAFGAGVERVPIFQGTKVTDKEALSRCFDDLLGACVSISEIYFLASVTEKVSAYEKDYINSPADVLYYTYMHLVERFVYLLRHIKKAFGRPAFGLVYADQDNGTYRKALESLHIGTVLKGSSFYTAFPEIVEMVAFLPSHVSTGLKIADYIAGAVYRYYESQDSNWLSHLVSRFYSRHFPQSASTIQDIKGYGIKVFP